MMIRRNFKLGGEDPNECFGIYSAGKSLGGMNLHANGQVPFSLAHKDETMKRTFKLPNWFYIT